MDQIRHDALAGQVAVVVGATRGIGRETARALAAHGASVVVVGRSSNASPNPVMAGTVDGVTDELLRSGATVEGVVADGSTEDGVAAVRSRTLDRFGRCDILILNAAYSTDFGPAATTPVSRWNTAWKVNVLGPLHACQAFVPGMVERGGGHVVAVSSGASTHHVPGQLPYGATKAALERMTMGFAGDYGSEGVFFDVLRIDEAVPTETYLMVSGRIGITERERPLATPADVGNAIAWLVSRQGQPDGRILGMGDLRALGAMPPPSVVIGSGTTA
jgi:NAD(P)-dependent dehydrogenase (short-subunit alcohol dehydrogenase family)